MRVWWLLSVILVGLMLVVLVLARSMPFALQAVSVVALALWTIALIYFVLGRR